MRPGRFGLSTLAALLAGVLMASAAATAAEAAAAPPKGPEITKEQRDAGMKAAPALIQAVGVPCVVADARMIGATPPDPKTKAVSTYYEVACKGSMGFVLVDHGKGGEAPSLGRLPRPGQGRSGQRQAQRRGLLPAGQRRQQGDAGALRRQERRAVRRDERARRRSLAEVRLLRGRLQQRPRLRRDHLVAAEPRPEGAADHLPGVRRDEPGGLQADDHRRADGGRSTRWPPSRARTARSNRSATC